MSEMIGRLLQPIRFSCMCERREADGCAQISGFCAGRPWLYWAPVVAQKRRRPAGRAGPLLVSCAGDRRSRSRRRGGEARASSDAARQRPDRPHPLSADRQVVLAGWLVTPIGIAQGRASAPSGRNPVARSSANPPRQLASRLCGMASAAAGRTGALLDHGRLRASTATHIVAIYQFDTSCGCAAVIVRHFV